MEGGGPVQVGWQENPSSRILIPRERQLQPHKIVGWRRKNRKLPHEGECVVFSFGCTFLAFLFARCLHFGAVVNFRHLVVMWL